MTNLWLSRNNLWWRVEFLFDWSCIVMRWWDGDLSWCIYCPEVSGWRVYDEVLLSLPRSRSIRRREKLILVQNWSFLFALIRAECWVCRNKKTGSIPCIHEMFISFQWQIRFLPPSHSPWPVPMWHGVTWYTWGTVPESGQTDINIAQCPPDSKSWLQVTQ